MRDDLLLYYERELAHMRQMGAQFAQKYPKIASRLQLPQEATECEDPHVERILEGVALLAARVHLKLDDDFPEITEALLGILYPHFIRPVPSMSIVEFQLDLVQSKLTTGLPLERNTTLYSRPVNGVPCKFRTCFDTTLWPLTVTAAEWTTPDRLRPAIRASDSAFALRLELQSAPDVPLPKLGLDRLRFYLAGDAALAHLLYELLCSRVSRTIVRDPARGSKVPSVTLAGSAIRPVGFSEDEALLPYPRRSFAGYRLLQEYFAMPEKFLFVEVGDLQRAWPAGFGNQFELIFLVSEAGNEDRRQRLEIGVDPKVFRLGCVPVVNLYPQTAEPILLDQRRYEYQVIPDIRRPAATEVFSIESVSAIDPATRQPVEYRPFFSYTYGATDSRHKCFWTAARRPSNRVDDDGSDIYISLVDRSMHAAQPDSDTITVRTICTNRNLPARLPFGREDGDFELESNAPVRRIVALKKPTAPVRPPTSKMALWHLISHLSLNYLSLVEEGRHPLQQILRLYNFTDSPSAQKMIEGITGLQSHRHFARVVSENGITFARGLRVEMELDEELFVGGGAYLFASVIEHFLALYTSLNSFTQLVATTRQRKEALREWPPRAGSKILL